MQIGCNRGCKTRRNTGFRARDRGFESFSLQRRVSCELDRMRPRLLRGRRHDGTRRPRIFDGGPGLRELCNVLAGNPPARIDLFLTPTQYGHVTGVPFMAAGRSGIYRYWVGSTSSDKVLVKGHPGSSSTS